jgi:hypothetical protein
MIYHCHFCREPIDPAGDLHTVVRNYPLPGCEPTFFCAACVDADQPAEVRGERIRQLFICLVTADDLDGPRILPGAA